MKFKESPTIKAVQLKRLNHFPNILTPVFAGKWNFPKWCQGSIWLHLHRDPSVRGHTHESAVWDQQLCEEQFSVCRAEDTATLIYPSGDLCQGLLYGRGKNSEHRGKWYSWVSSADSWHSTLWLELILPKGTTCASKQMGNKRSLRKCHTSNPSTTTCLQSYVA